MQSPAPGLGLPVPGSPVPGPHASGLRYHGYIPGLDVLRGLAILLVVLYHATVGRLPWADVTDWMRYPLKAALYGITGVQLFFVLSGFLISGILIDSAANQDYYRTFYIRRALRILPAYLLMLTVLRLDHAVSWRFVLAALLYIANMASLVGASSSEYGPLWSLAVEEQFYLIWPVIVRRLSLQAITRLILIYYVLIEVVRLLCVVYLPHADRAHKLWFSAEPLLAGALVAIGLRRNLLRRDNITRLIWCLAAIAILLWLVVSYIDARCSVTVRMLTLGSLASYRELATYCVLLLLVVRSNCGPVAPRSQPVVFRLLAFFGYISYGLYLVHQFVISTFDRLVRSTALMIGPDRPAALLLNSFLCLAISTGIAYLSRRYFEEWFLRRKGRVVPHKNSVLPEEPATSLPAG